MAHQPLLVIQCQIHFYTSNCFFVYTQLNIKTVLFQTIQFSTSTQFKYKKKVYVKQFSLAEVHCLVLVDP